MNIRTLKYIATVAKYGHFTKAAAHCNISQSALSSQIRKFEDQLGVSIFERSTKKTIVTDAGKQIVAMANRMLEIYRDMGNVANGLQQPLSGRIRIGMIPTIAPFLIPKIAGGLGNILPHCDISYCEDVTDRLVENLVNNELDVVIASTLPEMAELTVLPMFCEPFVCVTHPANPLSKKRSLQVKDLPVDELLLLSEGHCLRDQSMELCGVAHKGTPATLWATSVETLINMVATNQGITVVPALATTLGNRSGDQVVFCQISDEKAQRKINLAYRTSYRGIDKIDAIIETMRKCLSDYPVRPAQI